ncbi:hypothetical protein KR222_008474, partial [Zaprionus bogoriensis]
LFHSMQGIRCFVLVALCLATLVLCSDDNYRLPMIYSPQHYDLRIVTHLNGPDQLRFEGEVKIDFRVLEQTGNITLHAKNLTIDERRITLSSFGNEHCLNDFELNDDKEFYIIKLCEALQRNVLYRLFIPFEAPLNANQTGYYWSSYNDSTSSGTSYLAVTQFSPTFARFAFPCFDEPHLKATFRVTLGYHSGYKGLSNTPVSRCIDHETLEHYVWCEHEPLFRTSTYLVAYAVHNLSSIATQTHDIAFRSWMQPKLLQEGSFMANFAPRVIDYLEQQLEMKFPLRKVDQLAVPTHKFTAMENWGLVTFKESRFTINDLEDAQSGKQDKAETMAHEYAHQWFGNLVTMNWWRDLWLKEGPSTYFAYLALDALHPEWASGQSFIARDLSMFFRQDALNTTIAISREVQDSASILKQFSDYVYKKGSLTMRMLHKLLGDEVFLAGIRSFLQHHAYDSVSQSDLWQHLQQAADARSVLPADVPLSAVMDSWTLQKGYPLVSVQRNYAAGTAHIKQTRFVLLKHDQPDSCWWIPLTFVPQQRADFNETQAQYWLKCPVAEQVLQLPDEASPDTWIMLNPQVNTIYRVDYDERNWHMLIQTLNSSQDFEVIHELNRAQLLDDLMALAAADLRSYELAFSLLEYLPHEPHLFPWTRILDVLNRQGSLLRGEQAQLFSRFMRRLIAPLFKRCLQLEAIGECSVTSQALALYRLGYEQACRYGFEDCIDQVMALDEHRTPVDLRDIVYCTCIEHGDESSFQLMRQRFENSTNESQRQDWATGLGCCRNFTYLQQFLDYLLQSSKASLSSFYFTTAVSALRQKHVALEISQHILQHA